MALVKYTFTKLVNSSALEGEIRKSSITVALSHIETVGATLNIYFKDNLSTPDQTTLSNIVATHVNVIPPPTPINARNEPIIESSLRVGKPGTKGMSLLSPNFCAPTSWYQKSVRATNAALTDNGDHQNYHSDLTPWIDIYHPTLTYTEFQIPKRDGTFGKHADWDVQVFVNNVKQSPTLYTVNHANGMVTFNSALNPADVVTATFSHLHGVAKPSEWLMVPPAGYKYVVEHVEIQVSKDIGVLQTPLSFEVWAGKWTNTVPRAVDVTGYAGFPELFFGDPRIPGGGYGQFKARYRNMTDIINACNEGKGVIDPVAEIPAPLLILPFNYLQSWTLDSQYGTLFRIWLEKDIALGPAWIATATFYIQLSPSDK